MSTSLNKVILVGNVGKDPDIRFLPDGSKVASFSIATSESWKDKTTGEKRDKTEWHRVVVFNERLSEIVEKFIKKGAKVFVEGQLQTRKWTDASGTDKYTTEVVLSRFRGDLVFMDKRGDVADSEFPSESSHDAAEPLDDDIPF